MKKKVKLTIFLYFLIVFSNQIVYIRLKANETITNTGILINNLDNGNFLYAGKRYYNFSAKYTHSESSDFFHSVKMAFTDGLHWINATFNYQSKKWFLENGESVAILNISKSNYIIFDKVLIANFFIKLDWDIQDSSGIDLYQYCNDTRGYFDGWEATEIKYANIESDLTINSLKLSDDRGNTNQPISISGTLIYEGGLVPPNDSVIERVLIINSKNESVSFTTINNGYFNAYFNASNYIGKETYGIYVDGIEDYQDGIIEKYVLEFDGIDDYIEISEHNGMKQLNEITIDIWIYPYDCEYRPLIHCNGWQGYYLRLNPGGGFLFFIRNSKENVTIIDEVHVKWYNIGEWMHVVALLDSFGNCKIYVNGVCKKAILGNRGIIDMDENLVQIGYYEGEIEESFKGKIDEVRIYNRALNFTEIEYSYMNKKPLNTTGLIQWMSLENGNGNTAMDISGRGKSGTIGGKTDNISPIWVLDDPLMIHKIHYISDELQVTLKNPRNRIDINENATIIASAIRLYDETKFDGILILNYTSFRVNTTGKRNYSVISATGGSFNITKLSSADETYVIWDRIIITEGGVSNSLLKVGEKGTVWFKAVYEYDGEEFTGYKGRLWVNGSAMSWSLKNKRWEYNVTSSFPVQKIFKIDGISDDVYDLNTFIDIVGPQTITWRASFIVSPWGLLLISLIIITISFVLPMIILKFYIK